MRKNPHVRICGGLGSATTLVYPTHDTQRVDVSLPLLDATTDTPDVGATVACVSIAILTRTGANSRMAQEQAGIRVGKGAPIRRLSFPVGSDGRTVLACLSHRRAT